MRENREAYQFNKMRVDGRKIENTAYDVRSFNKEIVKKINKDDVLKGIDSKNYKKLRQYSNFFFEVNGIYSRLCKYMANLFRYDWYIVPEINDKKLKEEKVISEFKKVLDFCDSSDLKKLLGEMCLSVIKDGCYYGYIVDDEERLIVQNLPLDYCRTRFFSKGKPTIEFNMRYFDEKFPDTAYRMRILNIFPKDFAKGYLKYKEGKLPPDTPGDEPGWYMLDPDYSIKININGSDAPYFISVVPAIIDLMDAQDLTRKKMMQQLLKLLVQKIPLDKNYDLVFDIDEAKDIHKNAVNMLNSAEGVDLITTFADIDAIDLSDRAATDFSSNLEVMEKGVFNQAGVSNNLFNTQGNTSLDRSILNDESAMRGVLLQLESILNHIISRMFNKNKKLRFKLKLLETTQYNFKDLSKLYKEQTQLGYSKMLPQIALGHSQSEILNSISFENNFLKLTELMIPPIMSSTMSPDMFDKNPFEDTEKGRKELPDNEKSDKTLANQESIG